MLSISQSAGSSSGARPARWSNSLSAAHAARKMRHHHVGCLVVASETGEVTGMITERDLAYRICAECADPESVRVDEVMSREVVSINSTTSITEAQLTMASRHVRHVPVIDKGLLVGVVSSRDILAYQVGTVRDLLIRHMDFLNELREELPLLEEGSRR